MKTKVYLVPKVESISLHTGQMIAQSLTMDSGNHVTGSGQVFSRSTNVVWEDEDEDEDEEE